MGKMIDFKCRYDNSIGIGKEIAGKLDLKFPDAYKNWNTMAIIAMELKKKDNLSYCQLPFCHTLEGEALGGNINFGDENFGPRAKDYNCTSSEELLNLPKIDYTTGRMAEVLKACKTLRDQGENVILNISGPFTIMNVLIDPKHVYKTFRKKPEMMQEIFNKFQEELLRFVIEAQKVGVNMISYADSSGGVNILGPKLSEAVVEMFTYPLLKRMEEILQKETLVLLCPKTTFALLGTDKALWQDIQLSTPMSYLDACIEVIGQTQFVGQTCIKNKEFILKNCILKSLQLCNN